MRTPRATNAPASWDRHHWTTLTVFMRMIPQQALDISVVYQLDVQFFAMLKKSKQADKWPWRVEFPPNLGFSMYLAGDRKLWRDTLRQEEDGINKKKFHQVLSPLPHCEQLQQMSNAFRSLIPYHFHTIS